MNEDFNLRLITLKGYLREFYVKPDMKPSLWDTAKMCLESTKSSFFAIRFTSDLFMKQFAMALLLSSGKQLSWHSTKSFNIVQSYLDGTMLLTEYNNFDVLFITHDQGTMYNKILGSSINQVAVCRAPKKTFLFDRGGYSLPDLIVPVTTVFDIHNQMSRSKGSEGDSL